MRVLGKPPGDVSGISDDKQEPTHVAFEQVGQKAGFLSGAFDELAPFAVARQVHLVQVEALTDPEPQGDFQTLGAGRFFQARHTVLPAFHVEEPRIAALLQQGRRRGRAGRRVGGLDGDCFCAWRW